MGLENASVENDGQKLRGPESAGLENDGQLFTNCEHNYGVWKMQDWKMTDKLPCLISPRSSPLESSKGLGSAVRSPCGRFRSPNAFSAF